MPLTVAQYAHQRTVAEPAYRAIEAEGRHLTATVTRLLPPDSPATAATVLACRAVADLAFNAAYGVRSDNTPTVTYP